MSPAPRSVVIAGASLSGHATARALRRAGFDGTITLIGAEFQRPYDRPPLSKEFLAGTMTVGDLALEADGEELSADWILGTPAVGIDPASRSVMLAGGRRIAADALVVATGSVPRSLPGAGPLAGVHTLRTLPDAQALRADLLPGIRLAVIGAGFIGSEVASTARRLGVDVTVIEAAATPLAGPLGQQVGRALADLHSANGVSLRCGIGVVGFTRSMGAGPRGAGPRGAGPRAAPTGRTGERVTGVRLADGSLVAADVVLVAVGAEPAVGWLAGSGLPTTGGLRCDASGRTAIPGIWGVGDATAWYDPQIGEHRRVEHWTDSRDRPAIAVEALLAGPEVHVGNPAVRRLPYFWSDQYGVRIQFAGRRHTGDVVDIEAGSADSADLLAVYRRDGEPVAVLGMNQVSAVARWRRRLQAVPVASGQPTVTTGAEVAEPPASAPDGNPLEIGIAR